MTKKAVAATLSISPTFIKTVIALGALVLTSFLAMSGTQAAECLNPTDHDLQTGRCLNYLADTLPIREKKRLSVSDIYFQKGFISAEVCNDSSQPIFHPDLYVQIDIPGFRSYWKKLTHESFYYDECQTVEFSVTDKIYPKNYLVTAAVKTQLPNATKVSQTLAKSSAWIYMAAPLRSYTGKRYDGYPVYANERVPDKFPYQQSKTHLKRGVYYPGNVWIHQNQSLKPNLNLYKSERYPLVGAHRYHIGEYVRFGY